MQEPGREDMANSGQGAAVHGAWGRHPLRLRLSVRAALLTSAIIGATTLAAFLARPARGEVSGALIFVVGITLAGATLGLGASLISAAAGFLLYNFYFAEPVLTFRFDSVSDFAPLVIFNLSAIISGVMAGRVRDEARVAAIANTSLSALLQISQSLQSALHFDDIEHALASPAAHDAGVRLIERPDQPSSDLGDEEPSARVSVVALPHSGMKLYRIECGERAIELVVAQAKSADETETALASALANLTALAMERAALSRRIAETDAAVRTENLKSALLSSVSHDLRTPLATISASASSLIDYRHQLSAEVTGELLRRIVEESERLNRFTANLLQMTRLEAGQPLSSAEIVSVSDMLSTAIRHLRPRLGTRRLERSENGDCLVRTDASLFDLALQNVLENAILYSPDGSRIVVHTTCGGATCMIEVADEGRGIPEPELKRVFERFYRVNAAEQMPRGSGLGLAIARGFVQACGGTIEALVPGIGARGTRIRIHLPIIPEPAR